MPLISPPATAADGLSPSNGHVAGIGLEQAEQHVDRRRLAGPVRAEQRHRLSAGNRDVDLAHRAHGTLRARERLHEPSRLDAGVGGHGGLNGHRPTLPATV
jgi:hypothetical protein